MTFKQEDALYDFLENVTEPFSLDNITAFIRMVEPRRHSRLAAEIESFIETRRLAFPLEGAAGRGGRSSPGDKRWISRRGCFEPLKFVIIPTRVELANGILLPGDRCLPFANPLLLPHEYSFRWKRGPRSPSQEVPGGTTEGEPEDFYPYYSLFGEEYAPQYVARDNPENEDAYNCDPYEDPPEVSVHTLDMRGIYRELSFVPGDGFIVSTLDWKEGVFELEKLKKDAFSQKDLDEWHKAADEGFIKSFEYLGPASSTEEQIAYAYWFGGERMRSLPAYTMEEYLYEKTDLIETVPYGIETRFWYAGKEIPDRRDIEGVRSLPDRTVIEEILYRRGVPVSEYVVQSFIRDALYRGERGIEPLIDRIIPRSAGLDNRDRGYLAEYVRDVKKEFSRVYSKFSDAAMGPLRERVGELHTAVIDLAIQLQKGDPDISWLPKHTFVVLSQIQGHAASVLEDLDSDEAPPRAELDAMENSVDSMIDTYEDLKELIDEATTGFRKNNIVLFKQSDQVWRTVQISLGGTDIWRRMALPENFTLSELRVLIESLFSWNGEEGKFGGDGGNNQHFDPSVTIGELSGKGVNEFLCEFGTGWTVNILILSRYPGEPDEGIRCVAGEGAAPPRFINGPLRFRRFIVNREQADYDPESFDLDSCNRALRLDRGGMARDKR
jgi:hypothetical protein